MLSMDDAQWIMIALLIFYILVDTIGSLVTHIRLTNLEREHQSRMKWYKRGD